LKPKCKSYKRNEKTEKEKEEKEKIYMKQTWGTLSAQAGNRPAAQEALARSCIFSPSLPPADRWDPPVSISFFLSPAISREITISVLSSLVKYR
jgi:hypothetical protein